ncbi:hypothetical protein TNCV_1269761 [Trichonephila clavipes]|nr:hypothetical protein TNCV_1269761 [Trichonephila clavipes]
MEHIVDGRAQFPLKRQVNSHNCRMWATEPPRGACQSFAGYESDRNGIGHVTDLCNSYSLATRLNTRNHIHARCNTTSHRELRSTTVKAGIYRRTYEEPIFPKGLASRITPFHAFRLLVMRLFER